MEKRDNALEASPGPGRPIIQIDMDDLQQCGADSLTMAQTAERLGVSRSTLARRFASIEFQEAWFKGKQEAKRRLWELWRTDSAAHHVTFHGGPYRAE